MRNVIAAVVVALVAQAVCGPLAASTRESQAAGKAPVVDADYVKRLAAKLRSDNPGRSLVLIADFYVTDRNWFVVFKDLDGSYVQASADRRTKESSSNWPLLADLGPREAVLVYVSLDTALGSSSFLNPVVNKVIAEFGIRPEDSLVQILYPGGLERPPDQTVRRLIFSSIATADELLTEASASLPDRRWNAARGFGILQGDAALGALAKLLRDSDATVARGAVLGLLEFQDPRALEELLQGGAGVAPVLAEAAEHGNALMPLPVALDKEDLRERAYEALTRFGEVGAGALVELLKASLAVRERAASALMRMNDTGAQALVSALSHKLPVIRSESMKVLLHPEFAAGRRALVASGQASVDLLAGLSADVRLRETNEDRELRERAFSVLGEIGRAAAPKLVATLKHSDLDVRRRAVEALLSSNAGYEAVIAAGPAAVEPLVRAAVAHRYFGRGSSDLIPRVQKAIEAIGEAASEPLLTLLNDREPGAMTFAAELLSRGKDPRITSALLQAMETQFPTPELLEIVVRVAGKSAIPVLLRYLHNTVPGANVSRYLEDLGWQPMSFTEQLYFHLNYVDPLSRSLNGDEKRQDRSSRWIQSNRARVIAALLPDLKSDTPYVREFAADNLVLLGEASTIPQLIDHLNAHGSSLLAEAYLNSGNKTLAETARRWANERGFTITSSSRGPAFRWGSIR